MLSVELRTSENRMNLNAVADSKLELPEVGHDGPRSASANRPADRGRAASRQPARRFLKVGGQRWLVGS